MADGAEISRFSAVTASASPQKRRLDRSVSSSSR
jgi:hypothetical protein